MHKAITNPTPKVPPPLVKYVHIPSTAMTYDMATFPILVKLRDADDSILESISLEEVASWCPSGEPRIAIQGRRDFPSLSSNDNYIYTRLWTEIASASWGL